MSQQASPYEILGVAQDADEKTIKKAKTKMIRKYHPDRYKGDDADEKSAEVNGAAEILMDAEKREVYDNFGYEGLERLAEGDDPSGRSAGGGVATSMEHARAEFGWDGDALTDDELFDEDFERHERRSTKDVVQGAKRSNNPFGDDDLDIDDLLAEARGTKKPKPKKEKKPKSGPSTLDNLTSGVSDMFRSAKDKVTHVVDDLTGHEDGSQSELADRLRMVAQELQETNGKLSTMSLRTVLSELNDIADTIENPAGQQQSKHPRHRR